LTKGKIVESATVTFHVLYITNTDGAMYLQW